ncbi:MAG: polysaccharide deacetylase family protein [Candidatus Xenobia bacterium]
MLLAWVVVTVMLGMLGGFIAAQYVSLPWAVCAAMVSGLLLVLPHHLEIGLPLLVLLAIAVPYVHTRHGLCPDDRVIRRVADGVALTFDDGPSPDTPRLLEVLAAHRVRATFFLIGRKVLDHPDLARQIVEAGHEVGVHGFTHRPLAMLSPEDVRRELNDTRQAILEATGALPRLVRAPWGLFTRGVLDCLLPHEKMALWSDSTRDWTEPGIAVLASRIQRMARPGAVLLLHDGAHDGGRHEQTAAALAQALPALQHVRFVPLDE